MGTLKTVLYQQAIAQYIEKLARQYSEALGNTLDYQAIIDLKNNHFQIVRLGWVHRKYFYQTLLHLDIKSDDKIWIQFNQTELTISDALIPYGVVREDIVMGFRPPYLREGTEKGLSA
jgi:hypothetical protein